MVPINVGRTRSVRLVEELMRSERRVIGVFSQRSADIDDPSFDDLFKVGTLARIIKIIRLGPGNYSVVLQGIARLATKGEHVDEPFFKSKVERLVEKEGIGPSFDLSVDELRASLRELIQSAPNLSRELISSVENVREGAALADSVAANLSGELLDLGEKQQILEMVDVSARVTHVHGEVKRLLDVFRMRKEVTAMVASEGKTQREEVLRQQMRTIKEELGEGESDDELEQLREKVRRAEMPEDALKIAKKQLGRLSGMQPQSAEYNVTRTYVEWLADLPWSKTTPDKIDVLEVKRCLDEDHYGLEKVKKRIVEYIAVRKLRGDKKGPILCFIGPPGVGKTSLGRSIARAMGRRYHRIALGGVRDEAEIRGHRRTYVGALPGRIIQALKKVETKNPVLVLDEIDKLGSDVHGDPSAALLEVLDPAQNDTFQDHYIDTHFDLSQIVFLATANNSDTIPGPLWDRLEVIEVAGYTRSEKRNIATQHLAPKQLSSHGLTPEQLEFTDQGIETLIDTYTREAGVRSLEREIAAVCRAVAMKVAEVGESKLVLADKAFVESVLGPPRYSKENKEEKSAPGVVAGLAWTPSGGDILFIEAEKMPGKGNVLVTGNLKSVMQESAQAAVSFVRSHAASLQLSPEFLKDIDLHIHVPKGGTPKDGPSAGVTMFTAVASLFLNAPVRRDVAMTGEITLRGNVLPVGGIKEKLLAAHRAGMKTVLIPKQNERDLDELPPDVRKELEVHLIGKVDQILPLVLLPPDHNSLPPEAPSSTEL